LLELPQFFSEPLLVGLEESYLFAVFLVLLPLFFNLDGFNIKLILLDTVPVKFFLQVVVLTTHRILCGFEFIPSAVES